MYEEYYVVYELEDGTKTCAYMRYVGPVDRSLLEKIHTDLAKNHNSRAMIQFITKLPL